ncbi:hypothetical protein KAR91_72780 [Candidatus Pacearchaeota archaeon]|nr:hypothetical protein [Candidatus Pacearchaeota archaeon]
MKNSYEIYGRAPNGARHNLGCLTSVSERGAISKAKKYHPGYSDFSATKE